MKLPKNIVPPPRKTPRVITGSGPHDARPRGQRNRGDIRRASIAESAR